MQSVLTLVAFLVLGALFGLVYFILLRYGVQTLEKRGDEGWGLFFQLTIARGLWIAAGFGLAWWGGLYGLIGYLLGFFVSRTLAIRQPALFRLAVEAHDNAEGTGIKEARVDDPA